MGGGRPGALRPLAGRHSPLRPQPPGRRLGARAHARSLWQALHDRLAARGVPKRPAAASLAALRTLARARRRVRREARLGAAELVRAPRASAPRTCSPSGGRTGSRRSAREHKATRESVGLFDQTSFAKFMLVGRDAEAALSWIAANDVEKPVGSLVYTQMLNAARRHRMRSDARPPFADGVLHRHRHRLRHARLRLDPAQHSRRAWTPNWSTSPRLTRRSP